jgi:cytochrome c
LTTVAFAPDGRRWYFGGGDGTVGVCAVGAAGGKPETFLRFHQSSVVTLAVTPDGATLASADTDGLVVLWDLATSTKRCEWKMRSKVNGLAFAPDSRHFAAASDNGVVYVFRLRGAGASR